MYECTICYSLNHSSRLHCQNCGTTPAMYSFNGKTVSQSLIETVIAYGAVRASQHRAARVNLKTVNLDYYAQENV